MIIHKNIQEKLDEAETLQFLIGEAKMLFVEMHTPNRIPSICKFFAPNEIDFAEVVSKSKNFNEKNSIVLIIHFRKVEQKKIRKFHSEVIKTYKSSFGKNNIEILFMKKIYNEIGPKKKH